MGNEIGSKGLIFTMIASLLVCIALLSLIAKVQSINPGTPWRNNFQMAALTKAGKVVTWGACFNCGTFPDPANVKALYSTAEAYAALLNDGTVTSWGNVVSGGDQPTDLSNVIDITSTFGAFTALKNDGTVATWGQVTPEGEEVANLLTNVKRVYASTNAFAALKDDGTIDVYGIYDYDGNEPVDPPEGLTGIARVYSNDFAFATISNVGKVVSWGSCGSTTCDMTAPSSLDNTEAVEIYSGRYIFAALDTNGKVHAWGYCGATCDITSVPTGALSNVKTVVGTATAFVALTNDGFAYGWGDSTQGGEVPGASSGVQLGNIKELVTAGGAVAALLNDGSVVAWGKADPNPNNNEVISVPVGIQDIRAIISSNFAFTCIKYDNTVVAFGSDTTQQVSGMPSNLGPVNAIYTNGMATVAWTQADEIISWGSDGTDNGILTTPATLSGSAATGDGGLLVSQIYGSTYYRSPSTSPEVYACDSNMYGLSSSECQACPSGTTSSRNSWKSSECVISDTNTLAVGDESNAAGTTVAVIFVIFGVLGGGYYYYTNYIVGHQALAKQAADGIRGDKLGLA